MSSTTPKIALWGLVAAGLVVAVGLGAAIMLPGRGADVGAAVASPTAAPTPAPTPTPAPSAASALDTLASAPQEPCEAKPSAACIVPGTYLLGPEVPGGTIDVPAGWWQWNPGAGSVGLLVERADAAGGSGWGLTLSQVGKVRRDPCDQSLGMLAPADVDSPAELAAVMAAWPGFEVMSQAPAQVGGIEGMQVRLTSTMGPADCAGAVLWETPNGIAIEAYPMVNAAADGYPGDFVIIDRHGTLLVVRSMADAGTSPFERDQGIAADPTRHAADLVTQRAIIDSIRFEGGGGG